MRLLELTPDDNRRYRILCAAKLRKLRRGELPLMSDRELREILPDDGDDEQREDDEAS